MFKTSNELILNQKTFNTVAWTFKFLALVDNLNTSFTFANGHKVIVKVRFLVFAKGINFSRHTVNNLNALSSPYEHVGHSFHTEAWELYHIWTIVILQIRVDISWHFHNDVTLFTRTCLHQHEFVWAVERVQQIIVSTITNAADQIFLRISLIMGNLELRSFELASV